MARFAALCRRHVVCTGKRNARFGKIDQVMGDSLHLFHGRLCRSDVHSLIDLHRIAGNDLSVQLLRQFHSHSALSARGRANDRERKRFFHITHSSSFSYKASDSSQGCIIFFSCKPKARIITGLSARFTTNSNRKLIPASPIRYQKSFVFNSKLFL